MSPPVDEGLEVRAFFVRERNALAARANFGDLFVDYYLHLARCGLRHEPRHDQMLKDALAAVTLHCASRPHAETIAWTFHFRDPLLNLFATGSNPTGGITGHLFTEDVKETPQSLLYSDVVRGTEPPRRSVVAFEGADVFRAVEQLYAQSEQRPARYFHTGPEELVFITAQPDCDLEWLAALDEEAVAVLEKNETLTLLETRRCRWACGCSHRRILEMLAPMHRADSEALFTGEESLRIVCPRCGERHVVTREALEAEVQN